MEHALRDVWAEVLNVTALSISVTDGFARLGGDSITAMQVVSRCRAKHIRLTVADILGLQTVRGIAARCTSVSPQADALNGTDDGDDSELGQAWPPSPIQKLFLDGHRGNDHYTHFNQSFILKMRRSAPIDAIRKAALAVFERHPMLRAQFRRGTDGEWEQYVGPYDATTLAFNENVGQSFDEAKDRVQERQATLDIERGPVFAVDVFQGQDLEGQVLLLTAHHIIVDLVSWRVIWHDFSKALGVLS
ncbi:hypothetical protein JX265_010374 [Neoarthrinium moseri]|uniref:Carrier domain-containing protein n=1 Tax=Neoarthrinium moseri TaxID=1658444 RepID=A0A9Q0AKE0_9PEZI|nr:hypothetical protein JX265_010374 [Neoarthrinium moseri]